MRAETIIVPASIGGVVEAAATVVFGRWKFPVAFIDDTPSVDLRLAAPDNVEERLRLPSSVLDY